MVSAPETAQSADDLARRLAPGRADAPRPAVWSWLESVWLIIRQHELTTQPLAVIGLDHRMTGGM